MGAATGKLVTVTPFEVRVAGARLKAWRNPYTKVAVIERTGAASCEAAVEVAFAWLKARVERFLGTGWTVKRGEGWR